MSQPSENPRPVFVQGTPIELCQFLKLGGLAQSGGEAKWVINEGLISVNGEVETQKRKKLLGGDKVTFRNETLIVECP